MFWNYIYFAHEVWRLEVSNAFFVYPYFQRYIHIYIFYYRSRRTFQTHISDWQLHSNSTAEQPALVGALGSLDLLWAATRAYLTIIQFYAHLKHPRHKNWLKNFCRLRDRCDNSINPKFVLRIRKELLLTQENFQSRGQVHRNEQIFNTTYIYIQAANHSGYNIFFRNCHFLNSYDLIWQRCF